MVRPPSYGAPELRVSPSAFDVQGDDKCLITGVMGYSVDAKISTLFLRFFSYLLSGCLYPGVGKQGITECACDEGVVLLCCNNWINMMRRMKYSALVGVPITRYVGGIRVSEMQVENKAIARCENR